jgi:hypothetical protein
LEDKARVRHSLAAKLSRGNPRLCDIIGNFLPETFEARHAESIAQKKGRGNRKFLLTAPWDSLYISYQPMESEMADFDHKTLSKKPIENTHEEFALFDKQGRSIGVNTVIFLVETRPRTEKDFSYIRLPFAATTHYLASVQATRDGTNSQHDY